MPDDATEFNHAIRALLDRYPKGRILAALQTTPLRPGPKQKDDAQILINMGRVMTWHRDLSDRAAAEIVTRHLPNTRSSVIDRIRKSFAKDRKYYLRTEKNERNYKFGDGARGSDKVCRQKQREWR
jgi:hypothetical protein